MIRKIAMLMAAMATSAALATSYTWTGGGADATSWNDEDNWDPAGVPGGGDTATFTSAATIADGIAVSSGELKIVASAAAVTINGVISGEGSLYYRCTDNSASKICLAGANTYSGGSTIDAYNDRIANNQSTHPLTHGVWLQNNSALGESDTVIQVGGMIVFNCANAVFAKNFVPTGSRTVAYAALKTCTIGGTVTNDNFSGAMYFATKTSSATLTVKNLRN